MNLLTKKTGLLFLVIVPFFLSCNQNSNILLDPGEDGNKIGTYLIEDFPVELSTISLDSFYTTNIGRTANSSERNLILAGQYNDAYLGQVRTEGYTEVLIPVNNPSIPSNAEYFAVKAILDFDYRYGDATSDPKIYIHQLRNPIVKDSADKYTPHYNFESMEVETAILNTETTVSTSGLKQDKGKVEFKLNEDIGRALFEKVKSFTTADYASADSRDDLQVAFDNYFKGLAIRGDESNTAVLGADSDSSSLVIQYKINDTSLVDVVLPIRYPAVQFNNIRRVTTGSLPDVKNTPIPESQTNGYSFVQSGTGLVSKFYFPSLKNLLDSGRKIAINKAELVIEPELSDNLPPSHAFFLLNIGADNRLIYNNGTFKALQFGGTSTLDCAAEYAIYNERTKRYTADISTYVERILRGERDNEPLVLYPETAAAPYNRIGPKTAIGMTGSCTLAGSLEKFMGIERTVISKEKIKLKIYYTLVP